MERRLEAAENSSRAWLANACDGLVKQLAIVEKLWCLLTSSFLSYTGAFTFDFRKEMTYQLWCDDIATAVCP